MKTYEETVNFLAEKALQRMVAGNDSPMVGKYETSVVAFVYGMSSEKVFDDVYDRYSEISNK